MVGRPTPAWATRRAMRSPDIHSGLVRAGFVPICKRSRIVSRGYSGGVVSSQHRRAPLEGARAGGPWRLGRSGAVEHAGGAGRVSFRSAFHEGWYPANIEIHLSRTRVPAVFGARDWVVALSLVGRARHRPRGGGGDESTFSGVIPPLEHTSSTPSRAAAPAFGALVPSERPRATQRPRSSGTQAPRTVERRAGRTTAPAGACRCAMGGGAAPATYAACASSCAPLAEGHRVRRWPSTTAPHRTAPPGRRVAFRADRRR